VLSRAQREDPDTFDLLLQATYTGYYSHPDVQNALHWTDPVDSTLQTAPFDVRLLDGVLERIASGPALVRLAVPDADVIISVETAGGSGV
jgi:hypothetical protein